MALNRILLAAGGTGGHVFPAIAVGNALQAEGYKIQFHTDKRGAKLLTSKSAGTNGFHMKSLSSASPFTGSLAKRVMAMIRLVFGTMQAFWHMLWSRPQIVVGFGGYASAPSLLAASLLRIPAALHEQNSRIGRANLLLARLTGHLLLTWQDSKPLPASAKIRITGLPVAASLHEISEQTLKSGTDVYHLHVQGGSLGAHIFSQIVPQALAQLPEALKQRLHISQQVRAEDLEQTKADYKAIGINAELAPFFNDIPNRLAAADLIISRSGAASTAEIAAAGRPAIFIPFAGALDDHQTANAEALSSVKAAYLCKERETTAETLSALLLSLLSEPETLVAMGKAARKVSHPQATQQIIAALQELAQTKSWSPS